MVRLTQRELERLPPPTPWWMLDFGYGVNRFTRGRISEYAVVDLLVALDPSKIGRKRRAWFKQAQPKL